MHGYEITLWWSEDDAVFVAEARELPGCMAHGKTETDAIANVKEAMRLWIDVARSAGDPVPESKQRRTLRA
ncbi:MAG: type II toxin-antitoxin system HicB family antitoxin [Candidatus Binatia bacterium]